MALENVHTIVGHLTADPELRYTQAGTAVANFTIAHTPRKFDRQSNDWKDGDTIFMRSTIWRDFAENLAASLSKGDRVVAVGSLTQRSFEDKEGNQRTVIELDVEEIGASMRFATLDGVTRTSGKKSGNTNAKPKASQEKAKVGAGAPAQDDDEDDF